MTGYTPPDGIKSPGSKEAPTNCKSWRRRDHPWLTGLATGLISAVMVAFYLSATGQAALTAVRHGFAMPSCSDPQWLLQVPDNQVSASAYYVQTDTIPGYKEFHRPGDTIDGDLGTSWLQFWPSTTSKLGNGSSNYIEWTFPQREDVRLICIVDGWAEDNMTYENTFPISAATVYAASSGIPPANGPPRSSTKCHSSTPRFKDYLGKDGLVSPAAQWQPIKFGCRTADIVLHIDSASAANRKHVPTGVKLYGWQKPLTGISEVRFYYCPNVLCLLRTN
jgi:hypothetical protein